MNLVAKSEEFYGLFKTDVPPEIKDFLKDYGIKYFLKQNNNFSGHLPEYESEVYFPSCGNTHKIDFGLGHPVANNIQGHEEEFVAGVNEVKACEDVYLINQKIFLGSTDSISFLDRVPKKDKYKGVVLFPGMKTMFDGSSGSNVYMAILLDCFLTTDY